MAASRPREGAKTKRATRGIRGAATDGSTVPAAARRPQQERGQRRVEAILDATAAIVGEEGLPAATMHAIARRSGTTIGSMYHFFPDREAILVALAERHGRRVGEVAAALTTVDWSALSLVDAVERWTEPLLGYVRAHPDLLPVSHAVQAVHPGIRGGDDSPEHLLMALAGSIVAARAPDATATERTARAAMMLSMLEGVVERSGRVGTPTPAVHHRELKRALVAYLASFE